MPRLDDRAVGWLRYLHRKATTPDDWNRDGRPHPHWDDVSDPPMLCWHRFDLIDSTYAVALMADRTPAWREVYGRILDELIFRHTGWWAARDWLTQIGHDPDRADYPDLYRLLIPEHLWGDYDVPGWTANGIEPWGLQMDPIGADGNLFFKGFFLLMLGLHLRTTGDERWNDPFDIVRDGENTFSWFHSAIAEHLHGQWERTPDGCHCENTKVWPYCLAGAGLGLQLHDLLRGTAYHEVFDRWWDDVCRDRYLHLDGPELPQPGDALLRPHRGRRTRDPDVRGHGAGHLSRTAGARRRPSPVRGRDAPARPVGAGGPDRAPGPACVGHRAVARPRMGPRPDRACAGERDRRDSTSRRSTRRGASSRGDSSSTRSTRVASTTARWRPRRSPRATRGGVSRTSVPGAASPSRPWRASTSPRSRSTAAWWDADRRELLIGTVPVNDTRRGTPTSFRVLQLDDPSRWQVTDAATGATVETRVVDGALEVTTPVDRRDLVVAPV